MIKLENDTSNFSPNSKVWIYQSNRHLNDEEVETIKTELSTFAHSWVSHSNALKAVGLVFFNRFLILMVDESIAGASGCSIDKSVHFMKTLEAKYNLVLFDRMNVAYVAGKEIRTAHKNELIALYAKGDINDDTRIFNNLANTKDQLENGWVIPLAKSWVKQMI